MRDLSVPGAGPLAEESRRPLLLIVYCRSDTFWKDRLLTHLRVLVHEGLFDVWEEGSMAPGRNHRREIAGAIRAAQAAILLISADFLASDFLCDEQIPKLITRHKTDGMPLIPILVHPCPWSNVTWLEPMQLWPSRERALSAGKEHEIETDLTLFATKIATMLPELPLGEPPPPYEPKRRAECRSEGRTREGHFGTSQPPAPSFVGSDIAIELARIRAQMIGRCVLIAVIGGVMITFFGMIAVVATALAIMGASGWSVRAMMTLSKLAKASAPASTPISSKAVGAAVLGWKGSFKAAAVSLGVAACIVVIAGSLRAKLDVPEVLGPMEHLQEVRGWDEALDAEASESSAPAPPPTSSLVAERFPSMSAPRPKSIPKSSRHDVDAFGQRSLNTEAPDYPAPKAQHRERVEEARRKGELTKLRYALERKASDGTASTDDLVTLDALCSLVRDVACRGRVAVLIEAKRDLTSRPKASKPAAGVFRDPSLD